MSKWIRVSSVFALAFVASWGLSSTSQACPSAKNAKLYSSPKKVVAAKKVKPKMACQVDLQVSGMSCAVGCPPRVIKALKKVKGVLKVSVHFKQQKVVVHMAKGSCNNKGVKAMITALKGKSYTGKFVKLATAAQLKKAAKKGSKKKTTS